MLKKSLLMNILVILICFFSSILYAEIPQIPYFGFWLLRDNNELVEIKSVSIKEVKVGRGLTRNDKENSIEFSENDKILYYFEVAPEGLMASVMEWSEFEESICGKINLYLAKENLEIKVNPVKMISEIPVYEIMLDLESVKIWSKLLVFHDCALISYFAPIEGSIAYPLIFYKKNVPQLSENMLEMLRTLKKGRLKKKR